MWFKLRHLRNGMLVVLPLLLVMLFAQGVAAQDQNGHSEVTPAPCAPTQPAGWVAYVIQRDDTLSEIAARTGSSVEELVRVNCIANPRLIRPGTEIFVPLPIDDHTIAERCRRAGIDLERCRHLFFGDDNQIAERCRLAGIDPERCRALFGDGGHTIAERCRLNEIEPERCRALFFGDDNNLAERCRFNEIEPERCRELLFGHDDATRDDNSGPGSISGGHGSDDTAGDDDSGGGGSSDDSDHNDDNGRGRDGEGSDDGGGSGSNRGEG